MAPLIRMTEYRPAPGFVQFERAEISQLLALYAMRVAGGDWRDYAIDLNPDGAAFSVFRHAMERPLYTITKLPTRQRGVTWTVSGSAGRRPLRYCSLGEALAALERTPRLVPS
ncbi:MAG: DUF2794 domain-containing protein [Magnetospirillum sp.]|nr:DUF2794 domain-containing protein [Magnetospirillum sp.]